MPTTKATMDDLLTQARITNRLLAAQLKEQLPQMEMIALLAGVGASSREIATLLDTTTATVNTTLSRLRKSGRIASP